MKLVRMGKNDAASPLLCVRPADEELLQCNPFDVSAAAVMLELSTRETEHHDITEAARAYAVESFDRGHRSMPGAVSLLECLKLVENSKHKLEASVRYAQLGANLVDEHPVAQNYHAKPQVSLKVHKSISKNLPSRLAVRRRRSKWSTALFLESVQAIQFHIL